MTDVSVMIAIPLALYALWIFYLAVMALWRAKRAHTIHPIALVLGYPILTVGAILDCAVNVLVMSVLFVERPKELLVTQRLTRHALLGDGWRRKLAKWVCGTFLNAFDPTGDHCD